MPTISEEFSRDIRSPIKGQAIYRADVLTGIGLRVPATQKAAYDIPELCVSWDWKTLMQVTLIAKELMPSFPVYNKNWLTPNLLSLAETIVRAHH